MAEEVSHKGIVKEIRSGNTYVEIVSESACGTCKAASMCSSAEAVKKDIIVPTTGGYKVGDHVEVVLTKSMGMTAVLLAYILPLIILILTVTILSYTGVNELVSGLSAILGIGIYYLILYMFRNSLSRKYVFVIRTNTN